MKTMLFAFLLNAQDSVKVQVSIQARDAKYIGAISSKDGEEPFFDAIKHKFRVGVAQLPAGATLVQVDSIHTEDWIRIYSVLRYDAVAITAGTTSRIGTELRAINQAYLTGKLDDIDTNILVTHGTMQGIGLIKYRRF